jgi:PTH1 family peptidyl-tRNA hydrolase
VSSDRWLVVGLGNPGPDYATSRHNAGFMVVDAVAQRLGGRFSAHRGRADVVTGAVDGVAAVLMKPKTFMNLSGGPVASLRDFYKVPLDRVVVVHDELDLPFGSLRLKRGGGDGGHNGLRSITTALGGPDYLRVRVGIGRPPGRTDPARYVLRPFGSTEHPDLDLMIDRAADAVAALLVVGLDRAQNIFNS